MTIKEHAVYGAIAGALLFPFLGISSLYFWVASIFIDLDHYIDYIYHNGFTDFSLRRMFLYHDKMWAYFSSDNKENFLNISIFHTIEFIAPLFIIAFWSGSAGLKAACFGIIFHIMLDMIQLYRNGIFFLRSYTFIDYFIRKGIIRKRGTDVAAIYKEMAREARDS